MLELPELLLELLHEPLELLLLARGILELLLELLDVLGRAGRRKARRDARSWGRVLEPPELLELVEKLLDLPGRELLRLLGRSERRRTRRLGLELHARGARLGGSGALGTW